MSDRRQILRIRTSNGLNCRSGLDPAGLFLLHVSIVTPLKATHPRACDLRALGADLIAQTMPLTDGAPDPRRVPLDKPRFQDSRVLVQRESGLYYGNGSTAIPVDSGSGADSRFRRGIVRRRREPRSL